MFCLAWCTATFTDNNTLEKANTTDNLLTRRQSTTYETVCYHIVLTSLTRCSRLPYSHTQLETLSHLEKTVMLTSRTSEWTKRNVRQLTSHAHVVRTFRLLHTIFKTNDVIYNVYCTEIVIAVFVYNYISQMTKNTHPCANGTHIFLVIFSLLYLKMFLYIYLTLMRMCMKMRCHKTQSLSTLIYHRDPESGVCGWCALYPNIQALNKKGF
jgi:hypothetical protein